jgi:hypothetical protein
MYGIPCHANSIQSFPICKEEPQMARFLKRRDFLKVSSLAVLGAAAAACAPAAPPATEVPATQTPVVVEKVVTQQVQVTV